MEHLAALAKEATRLARTAFWFALAILFLIESWIWDHVKDWLRRLERALGLERFEAWLAGVVDGLSPPMVLALFAVPMIGVLPFKVATLALFAQGHIVLGLLFTFVVKSLTLGVEAFLFDICRDKLLQMQWFAQIYSIVLDVRAWALLKVAPFRARAAATLRRLRAAADALLGGADGELTRRVSRLRDAIRQRTRA